jgi:hypothetical protein
MKYAEMMPGESTSMLNTAVILSPGKSSVQILFTAIILLPRLLMGKYWFNWKKGTSSQITGGSFK